MVAKAQCRLHQTTVAYTVDTTFAMREDFYFITYFSLLMKFLGISGRLSWGSKQ